MTDRKAREQNRFDRHERWLTILCFGIASLLLLSLSRYLFS